MLRIVDNTARDTALKEVFALDLEEKCNLEDTLQLSYQCVPFLYHKG